MRKTFITLVSLLLLFTIGYGQTSVSGTGGNLRSSALIFQKKGPVGITGFIRSLVITNSGRILAGLAGGGIWYSDDNGQTWNSLDAFNRAFSYDDLNLSVNKIIIDENDPNTIYVLTGDLVRTVSGDLTIAPKDLANASHYQRWATGYPGNGIYVSKDGGKTFSHIASTKRTSYDSPWSCVTSLVQRGNRYWVGTGQGLFYTDDNFSTFKQVSKTSLNPVFLTVLNNRPILDIAVLDNNRMLLSGETAIFELSSNGDSLVKAYTKISDGGELGSSGTSITGGGSQVYFTVSPKNKNKVYLMSVKGSGTLTGIWKSSDNGNNWERLAQASSVLFAPLGGKGITSSVLITDPDNDDIIYVGGNYWAKYEPTTQTWVQEWSSSEPFPGYLKYAGTGIAAAAFSPTNSNLLFVGGTHTLTYSMDRGNTFQKIKTFSTCFTDFVMRSGNKKTFVGGKFVNTLINSSLSHGNYGEIREFEPSSGEFASSVYNGEHIIRGGNFGQIKRSINGGEVFEYFWGYPDSATKYSDLSSVLDSLIHEKDNLPGDYDISNDKLTFQRITSLYNTPFVLDEVRKDSIIVVDTLGQYKYPSFVIALLPPKKKIDSNGGVLWALWRATNPFGRGPADSLSKWVRISPPLVLESSDFAKREGPTAAAQANDADRTTFFGTSLGQIFRVTNPTDLQNVTFTLIEGMDTSGATIDNLPDKMISDIAIHPSNPDIVVVSFASYDTTGGYLYISFNATSANPTFTRVNSLPMVPIYTVAFNPINPDRILMVGTEKGLWVINDISSGSSFPAVNITDDILFNVPIKDIKFYEWGIYKEVVRMDNDVEVAQYRLRKDPWPRCLIATDGLGILETYVGNVTGIDNDFFFSENEKVKVTLFPNPAYGENVKLSLETQSLTPKKAIVKIYDLKGNLVTLETLSFQDTYNGTLDISKLGSGMYLVNIIVPEESFATSEKLIIRK